MTIRVYVSLLCEYNWENPGFYLKNIKNAQQVYRKGKKKTRPPVLYGERIPYLVRLTKDRKTSRTCGNAEER